jgi:hypothetical protein
MLTQSVAVTSRNLQRLTRALLDGEPEDDLLASVEAGAGPEAVTLIECLVAEHLRPHPERAALIAEVRSAIGHEKLADSITELVAAVIASHERDGGGELRRVTVPAEVRPVGTDLEAEIRAVRAEVEQLKARTFVDLHRGVYKPGHEYERGDVVALDGSTWAAAEDTRAKPGTGPEWKLIAGKGRDGRDRR